MVVARRLQPGGGGILRFMAPPRSVGMGMIATYSENATWAQAGEHEEYWTTTRGQDEEPTPNLLEADVIDDHLARHESRRPIRGVP